MATENGNAAAGEVRRTVRPVSANALEHYSVGIEWHLIHPHPTINYYYHTAIYNLHRSTTNLYTPITALSDHDRTVNIDKPCLTTSVSIENLNNKTKKTFTSLAYFKFVVIIMTLKHYTGCT